MVARAPADPNAPLSRRAQLFSTTRQIVIFSFFIAWLCINFALLGLISQQLNKYGNVWERYPNGLYYHALGLGLFATIFATLIGLFHWFFGHRILLVIFLAMGVFFGTTAGILEATPFGHGLQCGNPVSSFPQQYQAFVADCSRITAIEGLAWTMFAFSVVGFFFSFFDKFSLKSKREHLYEPYIVAEKGGKGEHGDDDASH